MNPQAQLLLKKKQRKPLLYLYPQAPPRLPCSQSEKPCDQAEFILMSI